MLNKKLVIAALLAVSTNIISEVSATDKTDAEKKKEAEDAKKKEDAKKAEEAKKAEDAKKKEDAKKAEAAKLPEDPTLRPAWQAGTGTATQDSLKTDGLYTLCDQGNTAMWKAAEKKYTDADAAEKLAKKAMDDAKVEYDKMDQLVKDAVKAQTTHTTNSKTFLDNALATKKTYDDLLTKGSPTALSTAKTTTADALKTYKTGGTLSATNATPNAVVKGKMQVTTEAQTAVQTQRGRLESLLTLKQNNVDEEAAFVTRVAALETMYNNANTTHATSTEALADMVAPGMTRSYLFSTLHLFDTAKWDYAACVQKNCLYKETANTKSSSTWSWQQGQGSCTSQGGKTCTVMGLKNTTTSTGIMTSMESVLGVARVTSTAPTGKYKAVEDNNYSYIYNDANTKLKAATDAYKAWQTLYLGAVAMNVACWPVTGAGGAFVTGDKIAICGKVQGDNANTAQSACSPAYATPVKTGCYQFNPLINKFTSSSPTAGSKFTQEDVYKLASDNKDSSKFGAAASPDKHLITYWDTSSKNFVKLKAVASVDLWVHQWSKSQLTTDYNSLIAKGEYNVATYGALSGAAKTTFETTKDVGKQVKQIADDLIKKDKAKADWDFAVAEQSGQADDDTTLVTDITNARNLLDDLVKEVADAARLEHTSKKAWEDAVAAQAVVQKASDDLGAAGPPATGEYAVWAAADDVKTKIEAQNVFHTARVKWATDNREPSRLKWVAATAALNGTAELNVSGPDAGKPIQVNGANKMMGGATAMTLMAKNSMIAAKQACKVAAFTMAQTALTDKNKLTSDRSEARKKMVEKYTALTKFPTDGSRGTLCNLPKGNPDGDRKECKEEEGGQALCCGAAQRFLKNGTKLTIETCQLSIAATFTYYPPLQDSDVEQPIAETWRFQCISGAQKLAAVAAAVLAAGAMIA